MKRLPAFLTLLIAFFLAFPSNISAATLDKIGQLTTGGSEYSHWWYTGENPLLAGSASVGSTVTVSIDGTAATTVADTSGSWTFQTSGLTTGNDYAVIISEGVDSYSFTLTIGAMDASGTASTPSAIPSDLPESGIGMPTVFIATLGAVLISTPFGLRKAYRRI